MASGAYSKGMKKLIPWLGSVVILILIFVAIYGVVQQSQRSAANTPQIQLAEDTAAALNQGATPNSLIAGRVSLNTSLSPFVIIYNKSGQVVTGSGYLNGTMPRIPFGVLTSANNHAHHTVTWQPQSDVRIAAVTVSADKYYVLSGRSLREVEANEDHTFQITTVGGALALIVLGFTFIAYKRSK